MARTLVLPINIKMDEAIFGKVEQLVAEANKIISPQTDADHQIKFGRDPPKRYAKESAEGS